MFGPRRDESLFLDNLQKAVGPIQELNQRAEVGAWRFAATFRGRPVSIAIHGRKGAFSGVRYGSPLGLPIRMYVDGHHTSYFLADVITTGDPEFDRLYKVRGIPAEVVQAALDPGMRQWYLRTYGEKPPQTDTADGSIGLYRSYRRTYDTFELPDSDVPTVGEIAHFLEVAVGLADRLTAAYHAQVAAIAATHGKAAADNWHAAQVARMTAITQARKKTRVVVFGIMGVLVVLPVVVALLVVLMR